MRLSYALAVSLFGLACAESEDVSVLTVSRQSFRQEVTAEGVLNAVRSTPVSAPVEGGGGPYKIAWLVEDGSFVREGDVLVRFDASEMELELLEGEIAHATSERKIDQRHAQTEAALSNVDRDRRLAQLELDMAQNFASKDPTIFSRVQIIESEIDQDLAGLKLDHADGREAVEKELSQSEIELYTIEKRLATSRMDRAQKALGALEVRAPHDGIVLLKRDWRGNTKQLGDITYGSEPIAELPALDEMEAEVHVLEADAGGLAEGRPATVIVEGRPRERFTATIARVDRMPKARRRNVPVQYFSVTLRFEETDPEIMKPGQRVRASLLLLELENVIVLPRHAVFVEDGKRVIYRRRGTSFETVEVTLGASSLGRIVIEKGLEDGDVIALRNPNRSYRDIVPAVEERGGETTS